MYNTHMSHFIPASDISKSAGTWTAGEAMNITKTGTGYRLLASHDGPALAGPSQTVQSNLFNITPAAHHHLAFSTQPANTTTQQTLTIGNTGGGSLIWDIAEEPAAEPFDLGHLIPGIAVEPEGRHAEPGAGFERLLPAQPGEHGVTGEVPYLAEAGPADEPAQAAAEEPAPPAGAAGEPPPEEPRTVEPLLRLPSVIEEVARMAQDCGIDGLTLHARTRTQGYRGKSDWSHIARLVEHVELPVIGNGDVLQGEDGRRMLEQTRCTGVMVGRGAIGNPWLFRELMAAPIQESAAAAPSASLVASVQTSGAMPVPAPSTALITGVPAAGAVENPVPPAAKARIGTVGVSR